MFFQALIEGTYIYIFFSQQIDNIIWLSMSTSPPASPYFSGVLVISFPQLHFVYCSDFDHLVHMVSFYYPVTKHSLGLFFCMLFIYKFVSFFLFIKCHIILCQKEKMLGLELKKQKKLYDSLMLLQTHPFRIRSVLLIWSEKA